MNKSRILLQNTLVKLATTKQLMLSYQQHMSHKVLKFECKNVFNKEKDMDEHKKLDVESQGVTYPCDECTFESSTDKGL